MTVDRGQGRCYIVHTFAIISRPVRQAGGAFLPGFRERH